MILLTLKMEFLIWKFSTLEPGEISSFWALLWAIFLTWGHRLISVMTEGQFSNKCCKQWHIIVVLSRSCLWGKKILIHGIFLDAPDLKEWFRFEIILIFNNFVFAFLLMRFQPLTVPISSIEHNPHVTG